MCRHRLSFLRFLILSFPFAVLEATPVWPKAWRGKELTWPSPDACPPWRWPQSPSRVFLGSWDLRHFELARRSPRVGCVSSRFPPQYRPSTLRSISVRRRDQRIYESRVPRTRHQYQWSCRLYLSLVEWQIMDVWKRYEMPDPQGPIVLRVRKGACEYTAGRPILKGSIGIPNPWHIPLTNIGYNMVLVSVSHRMFSFSRKEAYWNLRWTIHCETLRKEKD